MCNPIWTLVEPGSVLTVEIAPEGRVGVTGSVVTSERGATPSKRVITSADFPLALPIQSGTTHVVTVRAVSLGEEAYLGVASRVGGGDSRGPDECRLEVDENHPIAMNTIMAGSA